MMSFAESSSLTGGRFALSEVERSVDWSVDLVNTRVRGVIYVAVSAMSDDGHCPGTLGWVKLFKLAIIFPVGLHTPDTESQ